MDMWGRPNDHGLEWISVEDMDRYCKLAKEKGLQYVLDSSTGSSVIVATGEDLYSVVKKKLGF